DRFRVRTVIAVRRIRYVAAAVAYARGRYPRQLADQVLHAPEAPARENRRFRLRHAHALLLKKPLRPRPRSLSALPRLALRGAAAELVGQWLAFGRKVQRHGVDAVAQARRRRTVGEHVPLVAAAAGAKELCTHHAVTRIALLTQV